MHTIIAKRDPESGLYDKRCLWLAMIKHDYENYEPEYPMGRGATPLEAVGDLFWMLDLDEDTPHSLEILEDE